MKSEERFHADFAPQWCPGCGNFDLLDCVRQALTDLYDPREVILVTGIGQTGKLGFSVRANLFNGLHGRSLPLATGMLMANRGAKVLVVAGDGDLYSEGGNHFIHALRRNLDVTIVAGDNRVYGLTKGQGSPTSTLDFRAPLHRNGVAPQPINPVALALVSGATFVARTFSANREELSGLLKAGLEHRGVALIDTLFPCVSFNRVNTLAWYKKRLRAIGADHDPGDFEAALQLANQSEEEIATGIYYQVARPIFSDRLEALDGEPLVSRAGEWGPDRVKGLFAAFR
jgi:2-oxoglutarate ferredoxin oxidoreductase subunit beta